MSQEPRLFHRVSFFAPVCLAVVLCLPSTLSKQFKECGSENPNGYEIDLSEPQSPGPFHDLTTEELRNLRTYLENDPDIRAVKPKDARIDSSFIHAADLFVPPKAQVLEYLDNGGPQPPRQARAMVFRGDLNPPTVIEYICGPLPNITECQMMEFPNRRNPVEFEVRPMNDKEMEAIRTELVYTLVEKELGYILRESYGATFKDCGDDGICLTGVPLPTGSGLTGSIKERQNWFVASYDIPFSILHQLDFIMGFNTTGSDVSKWTLIRIWYAGRMYLSIDELIAGYNCSSIPVQRVTKPVLSNDLFSTLHPRGEPWLKTPQRPPTLVEPDGKRYSLRGRKVEYMGWTFNFRLSSLTGPALFDIRFDGERIAYELAIGEIAVFYSGISPASQNMDYVDSGTLLGVHSKALVPGADCPETATLINNTLFSEKGDGEPDVYGAAMCLFEQNNGYPMRRHLSYEFVAGGFYGGMLDSALTLRSILTIGNYDYIVDFTFHQNGIMETRLMSTGYILASTYTENQRKYGFHLEETIMGNLHHHVANFKADIDVRGTSNRYETVEISKDEVPLTLNPTKQYSQTKMTRNLKSSEQEALYKYNFDTPKYHVIHNDAVKTNYNEMSAYRIQVNGMSKQLIAEGQGNEPSAAWARHQIVVTKRKEEEFTCSSNYGMYDSLNPVVDFTTFYADNETIVDEDLVFWISMGMHHLPHTEDLPVTPTPGNHLTFYLLPYNYFPESPARRSRDSIYIAHKDHTNPAKGVHVERFGTVGDQCVTPESTFDEDVAANPDRILESSAIPDQIQESC